MLVDDVPTALAKVTAALPGGGEARPGQVEMAQAVAHAIEAKRPLVVQAGTGSGKSFAYLVPAVLSGRTTVVATATKALQDQLADKDLPFLAAHVGRSFEFAVLKGRANYLCLQKAREIGEGDEQLALDEVDVDELGALGKDLVRLLEWARTSAAGDRAELDFEPRPRAWAQLSVSARECPGATRCPMGEECFAEAAHDRAAAADVVVVNTHLYAMHLASGGHLLPPHDVVVFDEAHALEDIAASALGLELGPGRFSALARAMRPLGVAAETADGVEDAGTRLGRTLAPHVGRRLTVVDDELARILPVAAERVTRALAVLRESESAAEDASRRRALRAATALGDDLVAVTKLGDDDVAWVEGAAHNPLLRVAPVDVGAILAERLWSSVATAVLTSATIPSNLPARLGLPPGTERMTVESPFDFGANALLYCATALPDPRQEGYGPAMHEELGALIRAAGGRTLALFTSWRAMRAAAEALGPSLPWRLLTQDELPKPALLEAFTGDETSCLFATMGFWQGVDIPGAALSLLVIDRLPFPRPDEPLVQARRERAGAGAFRSVDLPRAATLLAQGAGRLIRSSADRGVVAVLDSRLAKASYRWDLVRALPPMARTQHREDVVRFLERGPDG